MSPAGAAVLRDVLVTSRAGVVDALYVPPVPGLWQLGKVQEFMRTSCSSEGDRRLKLETFYKHRFKSSRHEFLKKYTLGRFLW